MKYWNINTTKFRDKTFRLCHDEVNNYKVTYAQKSDLSEYGDVLQVKYFKTRKGAESWIIKTIG